MKQEQINLFANGLYMILAIHISLSSSRHFLSVKSKSPTTALALEQTCCLYNPHLIEPGLNRSTL